MHILQSQAVESTGADGLRQGVVAGAGGHAGHAGGDDDHAGQA